MTSPTPPVPFKDQCSIIHNNTLYVYSPNALQTLSLQAGARWEQATNGVSVVGARCVYGGVDGNNNQSALYIVGGVANDSNSNYPGLQRYSILDKSWTTITPLVQVTQNRQFHGAAYINASSGIIIYGGSQQGPATLSSETFFLELYPPYRVQAYSSPAPPVTNPFMMPWSDDRALMVGGSTSNRNVFTFGAADGWQDLGLTLPNALPNSSIAHASLLTLDDGSKIMQTFNLSQHPVSVSSNVLLNPGGALAAYGEVVGVSTTTTTSGAPAATSPAKTRRSLSLDAFPIYDGANRPNTTRTGSSIAQSEDGLLAFVGGDADSTVSFFNQRQDAWVLAEKILGDQTTSTVSTATATPTQSSASASHHGSSRHSHRSALLGGVLGAIFGLSVIVLILSCLWFARKRQGQGRQKQSRKIYAAGSKGSNDFETEEGLQSLSANGQPMAGSPVPSVVINQAHMSAVFVHHPPDLIRPESNASTRGGKAEAHKATAGHRLFHRDKGPLTISKPMNPDLGDYGLCHSPNIDLGRATPAAPLNSTALFSAVAASNMPTRNKSHRRTDEAWAKYFNTDTVNPSLGETQPSREEAHSVPAALTLRSGRAEASRRAPSGPGLRDSTGRPLEINSVMANSPVLESSPFRARTRTLSGQISRVDSIGTEYEDEAFDEAVSSGIPSMASQKRWTRLDYGSSQTAERAPMAAKSLTTLSSDNTSESELSRIPNFPMPGSAVWAMRQSSGQEAISGLQSAGTTLASDRWRSGEQEAISMLQPVGTTYASDQRRSNQPWQPRQVSLYSSDGSVELDDTRHRLPDDLSWLNLGPHETWRKN
ncbi:hypothetical protein DV737_g2964, partial [Chaetothyriales sp. CBS 132003]